MSSYLSNKKYFTKYYKENDKARKRNNERGKERMCKPEVLATQKNIQADMRKVWKLYKHGQLSEKSMEKIKQVM